MVKGDKVEKYLNIFKFKKLTKNRFLTFHCICSCKLQMIRVQIESSVKLGTIIFLTFCVGCAENLKRQILFLIRVGCDKKYFRKVETSIKLQVSVENPETFVEISQKLEVSNKTIRRSQVFLHL
jgi:hypothetical protein